jgi:O-antigen/teichoic acid export membrane protein
VLQSSQLRRAQALGDFLKLLQSILKPDNKPISTKVIRNVVFNGIRLVFLAPLPLVVVPFFLKKLGTAGYGTWAIFLAISSVTSLADLGLVTTLSKHLAEFYALKDFRALNRFVNTGFVLYLAIACFLAGILWVGSAPLLSALFRGSSVPPGELRVLWHYLVLLVVANILTLLFTSLLVGLQRMDLSASMTIFNMLASAGLSILFLVWNWGLRGVLVGYVSAASLTLCGHAYLLRKILPEIRLNPLDSDWDTAKEILSFSITTYVTSVAVVIHNQIEKIYLARFAGVVSVGWYDISSDLAVKLRAVPGFVLAPIMPAAAELNAHSNESKLDDLYYRAHKYLALIGVPFVLYIVFVAKRFVELWVGPALSVVAIPLSVLLIVNFVNLMTGPGFLILTGKGKLRPGLYSALLGIVLNLTLSFFLIRAYGFQGAVIGTSLSLSIASASFLFLYEQETRASFLKTIRRAYLKPITCSLIPIAFLWGLTGLHQSSWSGLVVGGIVFGIAYLVLLLLFQFFDSFDAAILKGLLPVSRIARRADPGA